MVQPFIPNTADAFDDIQASPESEDFEYLLLGHQRTGVLSGCAITESSPTAQTIDLAAGEVLIGGKQITVPSFPDKDVTAANGSNPRKDLISIDSSGGLVVTPGTPAAVPAAPAVPTDNIPLAILLVPTSDNDHEDAQISDKRVFLADRYVFNVKDFGATGDSTTDDTVAIQAAFDLVTTRGGGIILFPEGVYRVSDTVSKRGTQTRIIGTQPRLSRIVGDAAMTVPILEITMTQDGSHFGIENMAIEGNDSTNTGQHGIEFIVATSTDTLTQGWIKQCWIRKIGGTPVKLTNTSYVPATGAENGHGLFRFDIEENVFDASNSTADAGVDLTYCGDSVRLQKNLIRGFGIGIRLYGMTGTRLVVIRDNVITSRGGGIHITGGGLQTRIENNHVELVFTPAFAPGDACIFLQGTTEDAGNTELVTIKGNNIDAGLRFTTGIKYNIRLDRADETVIDENNMLRGDTNDIFIEANATFTRIGPANVSIDDSDFSKQDISIDNSGVGTLLGTDAAVEVSTATTLDAFAGVVNVDTSGGAVVITLPDNANHSSREYMIHRDGANTVTVNRAGSDTFSTGAISITLAADGDVLHIISIGDGVWKIL